MKIYSDWKDELIRCPSQCYKEFEHNGKYYVIYLRWRWDDPWTAKLIPCRDDTFNLYSYLEWIDLDVDNFKEEELDLLKVQVEKVVAKYLNNLQ